MNLARRTGGWLSCLAATSRHAIQDLKRPGEEWPSSGTNLRMPRPSSPRVPRCGSSTSCCPDLCGVLRGKRVDRSDLPGIYQRGMFLPGSMFALDVLGGTIQSTGLGFDEGDADRACVPIPDTLFPSPWMGPARRAAAGADARPRRRTVLRRPAPRARRRARPLRGARLAAGHRRRARVLPRRRRAHARGPRAAAALALHRPARDAHAGQLDGRPRVGLRHPLGDRRRPARRRACRPAPRSRSAGRTSGK